MSLTIELTPEQQSRLEALARQQGIEPAELAQRLVAEHLPASEDGAPSGAPRPMTPAEQIRALDELAEMNRGLPVLPDEAFERENLYDERF